MKLPDVEPDKLFIRGAVTGDLATYLAGRTELIAEVANRLAASDQSCFLFGERGVGKSTIARQIAALLDGTSPTFKKKEFLEFGTGKIFRPCIARINEGCETVGDLLLECVVGEVEPSSFAARYRSVLTSESFVSEISVKFGINVASIFKGETSAKGTVANPLKDAASSSALNENETLKRRLFQSFVLKALSAEGNGNARIIFIVDEMDRKPRLPGLGSAIKDINEVQFCFVGIADTLDEIIADHESAGRKLTGGAIKVPVLSDEELLWIFDKAEEVSGRTVTFAPEFRQAIVAYAEGMPWIAQHVGYEATFGPLLEARRARANSLVIDASRFTPAMDRAISLYKDVFERKYSLTETLESAGVTGMEALKVLLRSREALTESDVKDQLPLDQQRLRRWIPNQLEALSSAGVLTRRGQRFAFSSALLRIFTRYLIEKLEHDGEAS